ncbi:unnamed protein product [Gongylonema pulchrum]|uniref:Uncharacterized protein n=1 Tax=Gongylonema pulchrum TaxID=637853 RepID=A0A183EJJ3_9BILA|nr:unnamed protein product [Gongylonema pulchrum]
MTVENIQRAVAAASTANSMEETAVEDLLRIPTHHLLPIFLMAFILLILLAAILYDCKADRDRCRKRSGSESDKTGVYLYDGETGESRIYTE